MPNHKSAEKRAKQNEKRRLRNRLVMVSMRTFIKKVRRALDNGDVAEAREALPSAIRHLERAAALVGGRFEEKSNRFLPVHTSQDSALVKAALEVTGSEAPTVFPSVCDLFWVAHVPALVMGPGRPERSHQADEFVCVSEVLAGVQTYAAIARAWWERTGRS